MPWEKLGGFKKIPLLSFNNSHTITQSLVVRNRVNQTHNGKITKRSVCQFTTDRLTNFYNGSLYFGKNPRSNIMHSQKPSIVEPTVTDDLKRSLSLFC